MVRLCVGLLALLALAGAAHAERLDPEEHALWTLINDYRQGHGAQRVGLNDHLLAAAEWMSDDMAAKDYYSHTDSLGRSPKQRMAAFGYVHNTMTSENLAAGVANAREVFDLMKGSPEHDAVMLSKYFWAVGVARAYDEASTYGWYWTVDFGGQGPAWFPATPTPVLAATATPVPTPTGARPDVALPEPVEGPAELPSTGTRP